MKIELRGFGSARAFSGKSIDVPVQTSIGELRHMITTQLEIDESLKTIINSCAFASTQQVLNDEYHLEEPQVLNLLPPVCGG